MRPEQSERLVATPVGRTMTIGELAARTGVTVKRLRRYEDLGFIYTVGRSAGNYRLFDESALWCVRMVETLRSLGLTLTEIGALVTDYLDAPEANIGPRLAVLLEAVEERTTSRIDRLGQLLQRVDAFKARFAAELDGTADIRDTDPRFADRA